MFKNGELIGKVPLSWKKGFSYGVINTHKMRKCNKCDKDFFCED